jgi:hypothetical protein
MHVQIEVERITPRKQSRLQQEASHLRALPPFARAVRAYAAGMARFREAPRLVNKLTSYESRFRVIGYLLYLHADRERFGPEGGATYARLLELCGQSQEVSPRVLKTTLALLKLTGFVTSQRNASDLRSAYYRPTPRMSDFVRRWLSTAVQALDMLQPEARYAQRLHDDPEFIDRFMVSSGRERAAGTRPVDLMPEFIGFFGRRDGAGTVVIALMLASLEGMPVPSRAQLAARFGLSKTQVTTIISDGARLGYFELDYVGVPTPSFRLRDDFHRWISIVLAFCARHMQPA